MITARHFKLYPVLSTYQRVTHAARGRTVHTDNLSACAQQPKHWHLWALRHRTLRRPVHFAPRSGRTARRPFAGTVRARRLAKLRHKLRVWG